MTSKLTFFKSRHIPKIKQEKQTNKRRRLIGSQANTISK